MNSKLYKRYIQLVLAVILASSSLDGAFLMTAKAETLAKPYNRSALSLRAGGTAAVGQAKSYHNPRVTEETHTSVTLELTTSDYTVENNQAEGQTCQLLRVKDYAGPDQSGAPNLPERGTVVGIPVNASPTLTVLEAVPEELPGTFNLCPVSQPKVERKSDGTIEYSGEEYVQDSQIYSRDEFYPTSQADLAGTAFIRSQRMAQIHFQPFQYNPASGKVRYYRTIRVQVNYGVSDGVTHKITNPKNEGVFEGILSNSVANYETATDYRQQSQPKQRADAPDSGTAMKAKVLVNQDGIVQVTYESLSAAGLDLNGVSPTTFQLFNQGVELPIEVHDGQDGSFDPGDYFVFYGQGLNHKYTDTNVYWLTWGNQDGQRIQSLNAAPVNGDSSTNYLDTIRLEQNLTYYSNYIDSRGDNWWWRILYANSSTPASYSFDFALDHVDSTTTKQASLSGSFFSLSASPNHHTQIFLNGNMVTEKTWSVGTQYDFNVSFPMQYLAEGTNTIRVDLPMDNGRTDDNILLNWFEVSCWKTYYANNNGLIFSGESSGKTKYQVDGFTSSAIDVFDITNPASPVRLTETTVEPTSNGYRVGFQSSTTNQHRYAALAVERDVVPQVVKETVSNLKSTSNQADYLLITHANFLSAVQPLANWRASQGLQVMVIDVQDIYDEFNDGVVNADAIHDFIDYAYHNWQPSAPQYVLLVGDGNYDPHNYLGTSEKTFIPPYQQNVDRHLIETASDNRYVTVSGDDNIPDLMIGRLPVKTSAETTALVNKIINYEQLPYDTGWNGNVLFVADNPDDAGDFYLYSDKLVNTLLPNGYTPSKVYYGSTHTTVNTAKTAILDGINTGSLMVNYVGHGSTTQWASEKLLTKTSISSMTNTGKPSFFSMLACLTGYFTIPSASGQDSSSLAESLVKANNKGAVASWGSTGLGMAEGQDYLNQGLFKAVFYDGQTHLGEATLQAKIYLMSQATYFPDLLDTFTLFGDPAMKLDVLPSDLAVQLQASSNTNLLVGSPITYTLTYENRGLAEASYVQIDQALPELLSNPTILRSDTSNLQIKDNLLSGELEKLNPGDSGTIVVTGIVHSATTISTQASIESPTEDADPMNNVAGPIQTKVITENPTAVMFESASAVAAPQMILIKWITESEIQLTGFNIYRSTDPNALGTRLNQNMIPTENPGSLHGSAYEFQDRDIVVGETYYYTIETVELEGTGTQAPIPVTAMDFAFLPIAAR